MDERYILHGFNCTKADHYGADPWTQESHAPNFDEPFDLGGVMVCGRCHAFLNPLDRDQVVE